MKKSFLIIMLLIAAKHGICQHTYQINYFAIGYWNSNTSKYDWDPKQSVDLHLTIRAKLFTINDQAGSYFLTGVRIVYKETDEYLRLAWEATDDKERSCMLKEDFLKENGQYTGVFELYIMYKGFAYYYQVSA